MEDTYTILPFPRSRQVVVDAGRLGVRCPLIFGLLEFDVTLARIYIRDHKTETGETLSFTAFISNCLAQAIALDPSAQAYRDWRNRLIIFHDVDVVTMIEAEHNGVAIPHIIRNANRKFIARSTTKFA
jgi:pyruvate/2-oxoglutarate dehydrogenase complex dihydrolipoamide acyltransferase (E2) component